MERNKELLAPTLDEDTLAKARALIGMPIRVEQRNRATISSARMTGQTGA